jgi:predicted GNAT family N-acyltransferase
VDTKAQGEGLGRFLLIDALRRIANAAEDVAAHAVVLDAIDEDAVSFYSNYGFLELMDDPLHLFLPMDTVRQLIGG